MNRTSGVLSLKRLNLLRVEKIDKLKFILILLLSIGLVLGSITFNSNNYSKEIARTIFEKYIKRRQTSEMIYIFLWSLANYMTVIVLSFVLGTSVLGSIIGPIIVFLFGFFLGDVLAYTYSIYSLKGIAYNAVIIIPTVVIFLFGLIIAVKTSTDFSFQFIKSITDKSAPKNIYSQFAFLLKKYLIAVLTVIASALVDSILNHFFMDAFNF